MATESGNCNEKPLAELAAECLQSVSERLVGSAKHVLLGTFLNVLLVAVPMALLSNYLHIGNVGHAN